MAEATVKVGGRVVDQEEVERALRLLENQKAQRAKAKERGQSPEAKEKSRMIALRARVRNQLMLQKAIKAGITVTDKEVADHIASQKPAA